MAMKITQILIGLIVVLAGCASKHKAKELDTRMENETGTGAQKLGVRDGEMVVMTKVDIAEKLRNLQNDVYSLEDQVYGTRKLGSLGLFGDLKSCERQRASRQRGGTGTLVWSEPLDRLTDKEEDLKIGLNDEKQLIGLKDEYLRDRLERFQGYKQILQKRQDEFADRIEACKTALKEHDIDENQPSKVMVQEVSKASVNKEEIHQFMCSYVKDGASLKNFLLNAFAKGWLSLGDYSMDQMLLASDIKDKSGSTKHGGLIFNSWKLAYNDSDVKLGQILSGDKDASLNAWAYDGPAFSNAQNECLGKAEGRWNP